MDTLRFVLLAWILVVECLTRETAPQTSTLIVGVASHASTPKRQQIWSRADGLRRSDVENDSVACQYKRGLGHQEDVASPPPPS